MAALPSLYIVGSLLTGSHSLDVLLILAALLTEFLLALAVLLKLRQPGVLVRGQIVFVLSTAGRPGFARLPWGLATLLCR